MNAAPLNIIGTYDGHLVVDAPFPDVALVSVRMATDFRDRLGQLPLLALNGDEVRYVPHSLDRPKGIVRFVQARIAV